MPLRAEDVIPFATSVEKGTGLEFHTVLGWYAAEGGPEDNPLNIGPGKHYGSMEAAAAATVELLTKSGLYKDVISIARSSDDIAAEARAIAYSPWKGEDGLPRSRYEANIKAGAARAIYTGVRPDTKGEGGGVYSNEVPTIADSLSGGVLGDVGDFLGWISNRENWYRIAMIVGGGVAVIIGVKAAID